MDYDSQTTKHMDNLLKTVEGTGWVLCNALNTMVRNNITPAYNVGSNPASLLANNITEIFEVVAECEDDRIVDYFADKIIEFAGNDLQSFMSYMDQNMGDNPLYQRVYEKINS
ncbi:hypothetical protein [Caldisalinibacter kiritimatiensis]|uniref:Uncharacterized protein n=1 Tax=Caldisalinibacter kiritimatiensis TaxID=1304284 RepID=R1CMJ9_9FIRM|nr:hypothetical protein [Caldisalinibacter kiritimatiensis]EOC99925.1 hypothetical protein L21TH_2036 [Caldisalinibacter kiritimatiensis]